MEWISCDEKMPEPNYPVLFYSKGFGVRIGAKEPQYGKVKYVYFRGWQTRDRYKDVTHWMDFPKPPTKLAT